MALTTECARHRSSSGLPVMYVKYNIQNTIWNAKVNKALEKPIKRKFFFRGSMLGDLMTASIYQFMVTIPVSARISPMRGDSSVNHV